MKTWCLNGLKESIGKKFEGILRWIEFASKAVRQYKETTARN